MKTLEQLGISPAPWTNTINTEEPFEINSVWDARNGCVLSGGYSESLNDARLIAAAPELYEALREAVKEKCTECHQINDYESDIGVEWQMCKGCPVKKWRSVLANAAGESEVAK